MNYKDYIDSPEWKEKANRIKMMRGGKCQVCGVSGRTITLHVHHNTYKRLGRELDNDLVVLCSECHKLYHDNDKNHDRVVEISNSKMNQILYNAGITYTNDDPIGFYSLGKQIIDKLANGDYRLYDKYNIINIKIKEMAELNQSRRMFKEIIQSDDWQDFYEDEYDVRRGLDYWEGWKME